MSVVFRNGNVAIKKVKDNKYKLDYEEGNYKHFWKFVKELIGEKNNNFHLRQQKNHWVFYLKNFFFFLPKSMMVVFFCIVKF